MNRTEAEALVEKRIIADLEDCALVRGETQEFETCFAVYYQSKKYLRTNDPVDQLFGTGPVLVEKATGEIWQTGSGYPAEHCVVALQACGNPFAERTGTITIVGGRKEADRKAAIQCVRRSGDVGLAEAKDIVESALEGNQVAISFRTAEIAGQVAQELAECGLRVEQGWRSP